MSALIKGVIPRRGFELIRDRLCWILAVEFANQLVLTGDYDLQLDKIYMERMVPFDHTELPALNVGVERGDYSGQHQGHADGVARFFVECNTKGESDIESGQRGDTASKIWVQKLLGVAWAIIENPVYKTLGFAKGELISHRHCESFVFAEPTRQDAENVTMCRLAVVVKYAETTELLDAAPIGALDTRVFLHESEKGYYWSMDLNVVENVGYDEDEEEVLYEDEENVVYQNY
jgi:hypothetical protein